MECIEWIPARPPIDNRGIRLIGGRCCKNEQAHDGVAVGLIRPAGCAWESSL